MEKTTIKIRIWSKNTGKITYETLQGYKALIEDVPVVVHKCRNYKGWMVSEPRTGLSMMLESEERGKTRTYALKIANKNLFLQKTAMKLSTFKELLEVSINKKIQYDKAGVLVKNYND